MSLDVNGPEEAVMRSFPFDRHNITVLAIEGPSHGLQTLLSSQDYRLMCAVCRLDQLWVHWPSLQTDGASYAVEAASANRDYHNAKGRTRGCAGLIYRHEPSCPLAAKALGAKYRTFGTIGGQAFDGSKIYEGVRPGATAARSPRTGR